MSEIEESTGLKYDPRPVPPLGYCVDCLGEGEWRQAQALQAGTGRCAEHALKLHHDAVKNPGNITKRRDELAALVDAAESNQRADLISVDHLLKDIPQRGPNGRP